ncbi:hypothetical protein KCU88_g1161, partial [Aureobasidium melanogenum]
MTEVNGVSPPDAANSASTTHLGKRKRTASEDISKSPAKVKDSPLQASLQEVLRTLRKHDSTPSLLKYPLSTTTEAPEAKRARLADGEGANDTVEGRILAGAYTSFRALMEDLNKVKIAIMNDATQMVNGEGQSKPNIQDKLSNTLKLIGMLDPATSNGSQPNGRNDDGDDLAKASLPGYRPRHILSVRSQVNGGAHLLYSGLETSGPGGEEIEDIYEPSDPKEAQLPNGFEIAEFTALGGDANKQTEEKRLLGTVFRPSGRLKPLDPPRPKTTARGGTLTLVPYWSQNETNPHFKQDYRFAKLPSGSWIRYSGSNKSAEKDRKRARQPSTTTDYKAALEANDMKQKTELSDEELYNSVYSSFAPTCDNSGSIFSERYRSQLWWRRHGEQQLSRIFKTHEEPEEVTQEAIAEGGEEGVVGLEEAVANFEPEEVEDPFKVRNEPDDVDDLLEQISELIETLSSYQKNRSLEPLAAGSIPKPSEPEVDVFEMLRTQLSILVSSLPPFAVAKLNGDQLEELNISTKLVVEAPDYPGTGQVDDYTLRRQKMSQQATSAVTRTATTPQLRPNYTPAPVNAGTYNTQVRNYNSVPATAAYGMRAPYQTPAVPRPAYAQTPYQQASTPFGNRPTIQQFQRSLQNGYANYGGTPVQQAQTPGYAQRPVQPGYQTPAANVPRTASPQKPLTNAQPYQARQYPVQQPQAPYPYQRPGSATPGTPGVAASTLAPGYGPGQAQAQAQYPGNAAAQPRVTPSGPAPLAPQGQVQVPPQAQPHLQAQAHAQAQVQTPTQG